MLNARLPALFLADAKSSERFWEFFAANIRNRNMRRAHYKAVCSFSDWCEGYGLFDLSKVKPIHVAAYVEELQRAHSKPTVRRHLAADALRLARGRPWAADVERGDIATLGWPRSGGKYKARHMSRLRNSFARCGVPLIE